MYDNNHFATSEHFIQYQKAMFFGDSYTANAILGSSSPYKAKRLSYQINGMNQMEWKQHAYDICFHGVREKFQQNLDLLNMLCTTKPLTIAEASVDKTWGMGLNYVIFPRYDQLPQQILCTQCTPHFIPQCIHTPGHRLQARLSAF